MLLTIVLVAALAASAYDLYNTNKGLRAKVAEEGNELITSIWKTKYPTLKQLALVEIPIRLVIFDVGMIPGPEQYPSTFTVLATVALVVGILKNIQGGRQWAWMFKHPGQAFPERNTVWQKIMGFWG